MSRRISLRGKHGQGRFALVSDEDYEHVSALKWHVSFDKRSNRYNVQAHPRLDEHPIRLADFILGKLPGLVIDHKNHDTLDNRRENLRHATASQNIANSLSRGSKTGFRGVSTPKARPNLFVAFLRSNNKVHYLGYHKTAEDAARAYDDAAKMMHGEFAILNFPERTLTS